MAGTPASKADERRRSPRAQCRLHGRIVRGRERVRVRIVDVSDGGLCLLCPVWLDPKKPVQIEIDVPARGLSLARIEIWHIRREKSRVSNNKVWVAGAILVDADGTYAALLEAAGLALLTGAPLSGSPSTGATPPRAPARASTPMPPTPERVTQPAARPGRSTAKPVAEAPLSDSAIDSADPRIFRLRCKANSSPRTRVLSIAAESAEEAMELARRDLGAEWSVLEALEA